MAAQAQAVAPLLWSACAWWAEASGGSIDLESRPGRRDRWLDIPSGGVGGSFKRLHSFAAQSRESREMRLIKAAERAVEKARACYGGDPSHLLDICRARLIFGTAAELAAGLSAVLDSAAAPVPNCGAVRVVRVRNSLREDCDAASTCGFRVRLPPHWLRAFVGPLSRLLFSLALAQSGRSRLFRLIHQRTFDSGDQSPQDSKILSRCSHSSLRCVARLPWAPSQSG